MTTISAEVLAHSISPDGVELITLVAEYPRYIHAQLKTHRALSTNSASSRAIPIKKMIDSVKQNPALPIFWGKNKPGMGAEEELDPLAIEECKQHLSYLLEETVKVVERLQAIGLAKESANRYLESFFHIKTIISATDWDNFFNLRREDKAQPEIQALADAIYKAKITSTPKLVKYGEWHIPFGDKLENVDTVTKLKVAVARCARVSYLTHDGAIDIEKDLDLYYKLLNSGHMSPFEHVATPYTGGYKTSNFSFWTQYRKYIPGEDIYTGERNREPIGII